MTINPCPSSVRAARIPSTEIHDTPSAIGFTGGVLFQPIESLTVGAVAAIEPHFKMNESVKAGETYPGQAAGESWVVPFNLPSHFGGGETCAGVKPSCNSASPRERTRFASQIGKHRLCHVFGGLRVAARLAQRRREHQVHVPLDQSFESGFVALLSVAPEQLRIFIHHHSLYNIRRPENPTGNKFRRVFSVAAAILAAV